VVRHPLPARPELAALSRAYTALAEYAGGLSGGLSAIPAGAAIETAAATLEGSPVGGETRLAWASLLNEAARLRLELLSAAQMRELLLRRGGEADALVAGLDGLLAESSATLGAIAGAVGGGRVALDVAAPQGGDGAADPCILPVERAQLLSLRDTLTGQLRAAAGLVEGARLRGGPLQAATVALRLRWLGLRDPGAWLRRVVANLSWRSSALRHGIRLAAAVSLAALIGDLTGLQRSYWIGLTAVVVLRPDFASTFSRGTARALGTLVGVGVASLLALTLPIHGVGLDFIVGIFVAAAAILLFASYAAFSVAITGAVVFLLSVLDTSPIADAGQRLIATVIGSVLALAIFAVWPTWARGAARQRLVELVEALRAYTTAVLAACAAPGSGLRGRLPALERALRLARTNAEAAAAQSTAEPSGRRLDPRWSQGVLAALRRVSLSAHTLRARLGEDRSWPEMPQVAALAPAVDQALADAAAAIAGQTPARRPSLRPLQRQTVEALGEAANEAGPSGWVAVETDEMVDAIHTLLHLVRDGPPGEMSRAAEHKAAGAARAWR
jgi:uncharacterized membrane protein YccC